MRTFVKQLLLLILLFYIFPVHAEIYKWIDDSGSVHFSAIKPVNEDSSEVTLNPQNTVRMTDDVTRNDEQLPKLSFKLPHRVSKVPYQFVMTSSMLGQNPSDALQAIHINVNQKRLIFYTKLLTVEPNKNYIFRIRVLDSMGELVFDNQKQLSTSTNSLYFVATVTPQTVMNASGLWTIQGLLNGEKLYIIKRRVIF